VTVYKVSKTTIETGTNTLKTDYIQL